MEYLDGPTEEQITYSHYLRALIYMGMADEDRAKAGGEPYQYESAKVKSDVDGLYEAWKRCVRGVPEFRAFFDEHLTPYDKTCLGFNQLAPATENAVA